jgi:Holliday junction resolvase
MTKEKDRGTRWETAVTTYLTESGLDAFRVAQHGARDVGDIWVAGLDLIIEAKDYRSPGDALPLAADQATKEAANAKRKYGFSVIKRPRRPIGQAYVTMTLEQFVELLKEWHERD